MAAESKGKIRRIAISDPDPWVAAEFYKEAFGLAVDNAESSREAATAAGATRIMGDLHNKGGYEVKYSDPTGVIFDISEDGWAAAQKNPGASDNVAHPNTPARIPRFDERRAQARAEMKRRRAKAMSPA
jgi:hypothetical protein